jgi:dienelactone hydrolase
MMRGVAISLLGLVACTSSKDKTTAAEDKQVVAETTTQPDVQGEEVTYRAGDSVLKGYIAWDASRKGRRPSVIVVHEWWGHNDYVRRRARMLAEEGYTALALDMYGDGKQADHPNDAQKFMMEAIANPENAKARFMAAYDLLKRHETVDPSKIAAIGYCFGGGVVLQMARFGADLAGVASFHGSLATEAPAKPGAVTAKILVLHGADDQLVPKAQVEAFKNEMDAAGVDYTFIEYPGAMHAFTNPAATENGKKFGLPLAYDREADEKSWAELQKFLQGLFAES